VAAFTCHERYLPFAGCRIEHLPFDTNSANAQPRNRQTDARYGRSRNGDCATLHGRIFLAAVGLHVRDRHVQLKNVRFGSGHDLVSSRFCEFVGNGIVEVLGQALQVVGINTTVSSLGKQIDRDRVENELVVFLEDIGSFSYTSRSPFFGSGASPE
jgi:hypothetical protein